MPNAGDKFRTNTYQKWGEYPKRESYSRDVMHGEAYIVIPKHYAEMFDIYMSNAGMNTDYDAYDSQGNFICTLKAQGNSFAGDIYAKQFAGKGNLTALNHWIFDYNVTDNDTIEVEFLSTTSLKLTKV
jgi:hypothetical protein